MTWSKGNISEQLFSHEYVCNCMHARVAAVREHCGKEAVTEVSETITTCILEQLCSSRGHTFQTTDMIGEEKWQQLNVWGYCTWIQLLTKCPFGNSGQTAQGLYSVGHNVVMEHPDRNRFCRTDMPDMLRRGGSCWLDLWHFYPSPTFTKFHQQVPWASF